MSLNTIDVALAMEMKVKQIVSKDVAVELFDPSYYATSCGAIAYERSNPYWGQFFGRIADELIRAFRPLRVFDAGCAHGFLVEAFWDRGVQCMGRDISRFAVSQVRPDMRSYCAEGSIADPIEGKFDLVTCIEVLEHMPEQEANKAIAAIAQVTDRVLLSSSPTDFEEVTHVNVRPPIYWIRQFASHGFAPDMTYDATFVLPHTLVFERVDAPPPDRDLVACAELVRNRILFADRDRKASELEVEKARLIHEFSIERAQLKHAVELERARAAQTLDVARDHALRNEAELLRSIGDFSPELDRLAGEREHGVEKETTLLLAVDELKLEHARVTSELDRQREQAQELANIFALALKEHAQDRERSAFESNSQTEQAKQLETRLSEAIKQLELERSRTAERMDDPREQARELETNLLLAINEMELERERHAARFNDQSEQVKQLEARLAIATQRLELEHERVARELNDPPEQAREYETNLLLAVNELESERARIALELNDQSKRANELELAVNELGLAQARAKLELDDHSKRAMELGSNLSVAVNEQQRVMAEYHVIVNSTMWRALSPVRTIASKIPVSLRRAVRRS